MGQTVDIIILQEERMPQDPGVVCGLGFKFFSEQGRAQEM